MRNYKGLRLPRLISVVLILMLVASMLPLSAWAEDYPEGYESEQQVDSELSTEPVDQAVITAGDEPLDITIAAEDVVVRLGDDSFSLLDGVTAEDEHGGSVLVTVQDDGGFNVNREGTYTVEYVAGNPETGDVFTADRLVRVFAFDPQPSTKDEVSTEIDAYEAALSEGGFRTDLEVQKSRWQYEVAAELMPAGWRCDFLVDETYSVTYWTFFPAPVVKSDVTVSNVVQLQAAINAAAGVPTTIVIGEDFSFGEATVKIPEGAVITIDGAGHTLTKLGLEKNSQHHFQVEGELTLINVTVTANGGYGGVSVGKKNSSVSIRGTLIMENKAIITGNKATQGNINGGGVLVTYGDVIMNGGEISNNIAYAKGGGIMVTNGTFIMNGGKIINNYAYQQGGGVYTQGAFTMGGDSVISGNISAYTRENQSGAGGGVYMHGNGSTVKFIMNGGKITNNISNSNYDGHGGGVFLIYGGCLEMTGGEISGNIAKKFGGGVYMEDITPNRTFLKMTGGKIRDNTAGSDGGGVYTSGSVTLTVSDGSSFFNNKASNGNGGGIYAGNWSNVTTASDTVFSGNSAKAAYDYGVAKKGTAGSYPAIDWKTVSIAGTHALNNYDINWTSGSVLSLYTVTYDGNGNTGGTVPFNPASYASGRSVTVLGNTGNLTNPGNTFAGWIMGQDGSGTVYNAGDTFTMGAANVTLYAKWNAIIYTVTFHTNGGSVIENQMVPYGGQVAKPINPLKEGYTFDGWYEDSHLTMEANFPLTYITSDKEYWARWIPNSHTVSFSLNYNGSPQYNEQRSVTYPESSIRDLPTNPTREGYDFLGWADSGDAEVPDYAAGDVISGVTSSKWVYAIWRERAYTLIFDLNYPGAPAADPQTITVVYGEVVGAMQRPAQGIFTFNGWNTEADGNGITISEDYIWNFTENKTVYAQWSGFSLEAADLILLDVNDKYPVSKDNSISKEEFLELVRNNAATPPMVLKPGNIDAGVDFSLPTTTITTDFDWSLVDFDHITPLDLSDPNSTGYSVKVKAAWPGGDAEVTVYVKIVDRVKPVITVTSSPIVCRTNDTIPASIEAFLAANEITAVDNYEGKIALTDANVLIDYPLDCGSFNEINWRTVGDYGFNIKFVNDSSGNVADPNSFILTIRPQDSDPSPGGNTDNNTGGDKEINIDGDKETNIDGGKETNIDSGKEIPTVPNLPGGSTVVPSDDNGYLVIGDDGIPLGQIVQNDDGEWIFVPDESTPLGSLPSTGGLSPMIFLSIGAIMILAGIYIKRRSV